MELRLEFGLWTETILTPGLEFLMDQINLWWTRITTTQKFLKISPKNMRYNWMRKILHADQRQKQNHKEENLLTLALEPFRWTKGIGMILNQENTLSLSAYEVSKKMIHLLRHSQQIQEEEQKGDSSTALFKDIERNLSDPLLQESCNPGRILPTYLPHWMCVQSSFYHQLWINTWRSEFKQETDSILSACWS